MTALDLGVCSSVVLMAMAEEASGENYMIH